MANVADMLRDFEAAEEKKQAGGSGSGRVARKRKKPVVDSDEEEQGEVDELAAYLALPQIKYKTERDATEWWKKHAQEFPNVAGMARQYLGCPATSATVENAVGHYLNPHRSVGIA